MTFFNVSLYFPTRDPIHMSGETSDPDQSVLFQNKKNHAED